MSDLIEPDNAQLAADMVADAGHLEAKHNGLGFIAARMRLAAQRLEERGHMDAIEAAMIERCLNTTVTVRNLGSASDDYLNGFHDDALAKTDAIEAAMIERCAAILQEKIDKGDCEPRIVKVLQGRLERIRALKPEGTTAVSVLKVAPYSQ